ncbi:prephenate dehydrogenase [Salinisphaera sp.]|uniref:prephenate dehydrogenase n=1 Tax=Salinisphaera sp. TaxID=1914330 RepID=UPI002D79097C|nr:prephenate dehydrogenase/arogenate dehydrogenase family protein [Salinisphaera sp.]HET7315069.1 prephenate dehydrogenase/arogenate dehydrogenase family protein [Salinisphaera sp.]
MLSDIDGIAIVGLGLIGGSIARGLRAAGYAGRLSGAVASNADAPRALELGLVDDCHAEIAEAVSEAELIVVATPPGMIEPVLAQIAASRRADATVTDTGSSKASVVAAAARVFDTPAYKRFVPGHPIAGTENSGLEAGFATLFQARRVILTPDAATDAAAVACVEAMWRALGAQIARMSPAHHDEILAATSHLPHVLAYTLVDTLAAMGERIEIFEYAAGGFADFTRIASSDAALWRDIVTANREPVLATLDAYMARLQDVRAAIANGDDDRLYRVFERAKTARDGFVSVRERNER